MKDGLFRAKVQYTGEWAYGYLVKLGKESFTEMDRFGICDTAVPVGSGGGVIYNLKIKEVYPNTICEATGLYTADEQEIYENDICLFDDRHFVVKRECEVPGGYWAETGFVLKEIGYTGYTHFVDTVDEYECEMQLAIIGNAFDNKELMEGWSI